MYHISRIRATQIVQLAGRILSGTIFLCIAALSDFKMKVLEKVPGGR